MHKSCRTLLGAVSAAALALTAAPSNAAEEEAYFDNMTETPQVTHVPRTADSYPFNAADHAKEPVDLQALGYVEEEYFLSGEANAYTLSNGDLGIAKADIPYTNRVLVRRPADPAKASGTVIVDIYNASNGYDIEDMWRRLYSDILANGHTYVGVTSKPINVDALHQFDAERYEQLSWYDEDCERTPVDFELGAWQDVPCAETGLAWDIITQTGVALRDATASPILLGGISPTTVLLTGQSQSGMYLNTYVNNFHNEVTEANDGNIFDGYLTAAASWIEREIRDGEQQREVSGGIAIAGPAEPVTIDVPWITVDTEGDASLFAPEALLPKPTGRTAKVWQIPGTSHTYSMSPVVPDNAELVKANRPPRNFPAEYTVFPAEPSMWAAMAALIAAHQEGSPLPESQWFTRDDAGALTRDDIGNALGGIRYGMLQLGLAEFVGAAKPGDMNGIATPITLEEFNARWTSRQDYLDAQRHVDETLVEQGYLTAAGVEVMQQRAEILLDRIGVQGASDGQPSTEQPVGPLEPGNSSKPGLPKTGV